jgi:hypothetical protein
VRHAHFNFDLKEALIHYTTQWVLARDDLGDKSVPALGARVIIWMHRISCKEIVPVLEIIQHRVDSRLSGDDSNIARRARSGIGCLNSV